MDNQPPTSEPKAQPSTTTSEPTSVPLFTTIHTPVTVLPPPRPTIQITNAARIAPGDEAKVFNPDWLQDLVSRVDEIWKVVHEHNARLDSLEKRIGQLGQDTERIQQRLDGVELEVGWMKRFVDYKDGGQKIKKQVQQDGGRDEGVRKSVQETVPKEC